MNWRSSLGRSILRYLVGFFMAQAALLAVVFTAYRIPWGRLWAPLAVSAACHAGLAAFLLWRREDFRIEGTDTRLGRINAPNVLTIGRISSIPTILFLVLLARDYAVLPVALPFICLVFASDFVDGLVARRGAASRS